MNTTHAAPALEVGTVWHLLTVGGPDGPGSNEGSPLMGKHSADVPAFMAEPAVAMEAFIDSTLPALRPATPDQAGTWVDGCRGWTAMGVMIDIAVERGWPITNEDDVILEQSRRAGYNSEAVSEIADDAEAFMNDHIAPAGYAFGWHEGDFVLWSEADWCEASGDRCWCVEPHPVG